MEQKILPVTKGKKAPQDWQEALNSFDDMYYSMLEIGIDPDRVDEQDYIHLTRLFARHAEKNRKGKDGKPVETMSAQDFLGSIGGKNIKDDSMPKRTSHKIEKR